MLFSHAGGSAIGGTFARCVDGTRVMEPRETLARVRPLLAEMGITRIANVTGLDEVGIPTVMVVRPNASSLSVSQGKGMTLDAAKASGAMEAIELWHAENLELPVRYASRRELAARDAVVDVARLPRRAAAHSDDERWLWVTGARLVGGEPVWVPHELVQLDWTLPLPPGSGHFLAGSNGLASGNHPLEAIAHGLFELIERDAVTLFFQEPNERVQARRVELDSVEVAQCRELLGRFARAGVLVAVWDVTSDIGVPAYLVESIDASPSPYRPMGLARGAGCHLDPAVALRRALCEAAQTRLTRIAGTRDDVDPRETGRLRSPAHLEATRRALAETPRGGRRFSNDPTNEQEARDLARDIETVGARLGAVGCGDVVVVDLSRSGSPVSVVRVIVPGLEAFAEVPGYLPGERARASGGAA